MSQVVSEILTIEIQGVCSGGVFLRWENDMGGMDQWMFDGNTSTDVQISAQEYFEKYVEELVNETTNFELISLEYSEVLKAKTMFDKVNAEGFKQLLRSKNIQMFVGATWWTVGVVLESFILERHKSYGKLNIQVVLPKTYVK